MPGPGGDNSGVRGGNQNVVGQRGGDNQVAVVYDLLSEGPIEGLVANIF